MAACELVCQQPQAPGSSLMGCLLMIGLRRWTVFRHAFGAGSAASLFWRAVRTNLPRGNILLGLSGRACRQPFPRRTRLVLVAKTGSTGFSARRVRVDSSKGGGREVIGERVQGLAYASGKDIRAGERISGRPYLCANGSWNVRIVLFESRADELIRSAERRLKGREGRLSSRKTNPRR